MKLPSLGGPAPDQPQEMDCAALNAEKARLLAQRDDLDSPLLTSNADAERDAKFSELNGKLYTMGEELPGGGDWNGGVGCEVEARAVDS